MLRRFKLLGSLLAVSLALSHKASADLTLSLSPPSRIAPGGGNFPCPGLIANGTTEAIFISRTQVDTSGCTLFDNFIDADLGQKWLAAGDSYSGRLTQDAPSFPGWTCGGSDNALLTINVKPGSFSVFVHVFGRTESDPSDAEYEIGTYYLFGSSSSSVFFTNLSVPSGKKPKAGATIQVSFQVFGGECLDLTQVPLLIQNLSGGAPSSLTQAISNSKKTSYFHYDSLLGAYVFNWNTKGLTACDYFVYAPLPQGFETSGYVTLVK